MRRPVKLTTGFPSASKAAKKLGVTKEEARKLALLAAGSRKTGEFVLPRVGRLILVKAQSRKGRAPTAHQAIRIFTRDVANSRSSEAIRADEPTRKK